jgi:hypothetical protein
MKNRYSTGSRKWIVVWVFTALWFVGLAVGTWNALINGVSEPDGYYRLYPYSILALLWAFGIGLAWFSNQHPCTSVTVGNDGVVEGRATFPFRVVRRKFRSEELIPLQLIEDQYEDGGAHFELQLPVPIMPGHPLVLAAGSRDHCLTEKATFLAAMEQSERGPRDSQG